MNAAVTQLLKPVENPVLVTSLLCALARRAPIRVACLPAELIEPVLILSAIADEWSEPAIVDDYKKLLWLAPEPLRAVVNVNLPDYAYIAYRELTGAFR